ncbi:MAG TPA: universal stress protein [Verrucomicrobiae bacterium]|nr:universal stress protein [Verrucomicrobiae bacterium]
MPTKHILVPLDGSEAAEAALPVAARLAGMVGADITLLGVVQPLEGFIRTRHREVCVDSEWPKRVRSAVSYLLSVAERPIWKGLLIRAAVEIGEINEAVTGYVRAHFIDFIIWPPVPLGEATEFRTEGGRWQRAQPGSPNGVPSRTGFQFLKGRPRNVEESPWILENSTEKTKPQLTGG